MISRIFHAKTTEHDLITISWERERKMKNECVQCTALRKALRRLLDASIAGTTKDRFKARKFAAKTLGEIDKLGT